jgi:hypothetical protein
VIIRDEDEKREQHLKLLRESLEAPARLEILFRASEHDFSAAAFHYKCDNIENTFTLVKTGFDNILDEVCMECSRKGYGQRRR